MPTLRPAILLASLAAAASFGAEVRFLDSLDLGLNVNYAEYTVGKYAGRNCAFFQKDSNLAYVFLGDQDGPHVLGPLNGDLRSIRATDVWLAYSTTNRRVAVIDLSGILDAVYDSTFATVNSREVFVRGNTLYVAQRNAGLGVVSHLATAPEYRLYPLGGEVTNVFAFGDRVHFTAGNTYVATLGDSVETIDTLETPGFVKDMELKGDSLFVLSNDPNGDRIQVFSLGDIPHAKTLASEGISPLISSGIAVGDSVILIAARDGVYSVARNFAERDTAVVKRLLFKTRGEIVGDVSVVGDTVIVAERAGSGTEYRYYLALYQLERPITALRPSPRRGPATGRHGEPRLINGRVDDPGRSPALFRWRTPGPD